LVALAVGNGRIKRDKELEVENEQKQSKSFMQDVPEA
jgi:hypothetical protein